MNELNLETSPYLLQHAQNRVFWKAWNEQSLQLAKHKNQLLVISIGYSTCHWCHVMAHESFENNDVATLMNQYFVSIKVDREERPDIDAVYMKAVQLMNQQGGWPLNIVCLPDGRPIWGGTYFTKSEWMHSLNKIQRIFETEPSILLDYADKLQQGISQISTPLAVQKNTENTEQKVHDWVQKWKTYFDNEYGGYNRMPKFMLPNNFVFLMNYGHTFQDKDVLCFVHTTLEKMAYGGIFDVIEGGFSRYSIDKKWHIPHFEKMLYDNAQLVSLYADAYKLLQNSLYKEVIKKTLHFVEKYWLNAQNGFCAAWDADSLNQNQQLEEGAFYVWRENELRQLLKHDFDLFSQVFNINDFGKWENDKFVLIQTQDLLSVAQQNSLSLEILQNKKRQWEDCLKQHRSQRPLPRLDYKCLCSWNALMLKAFVDAYKALKNEHYLNIALKNAHFILQYLSNEEGKLFHNFSKGQGSINAYLEDYSTVIQSFILLYEVTLNEQWLHHAKRLTDYCLDYFYDEKIGFFRFTSREDSPLITSNFEIEDNVTPSSNALMANNLQLLHIFYNNAFYQKVAQKMIYQILPNIDYPIAFSQWLNTWLKFEQQGKEIAICGKEAQFYLQQLHQMYLPNITIGGSIRKSNLTFLQGRFQEDKMLFYLCKNKTCSLPTENFEILLTQLQSN